MFKHGAAAKKRPNAVRALGAEFPAKSNGEVIRMNWDKVFSRLSVPGLTLLLFGLIASTQATKLCRLVFREKGEHAIMPLKIVGLAIAILGALILLDVFPGM